MTIDKEWRWVEEAIKAGVSARMASWCGDDDEDEQSLRAEAAMDRARRAMLRLVAQEREECARVCETTEPAASAMSMKHDCAAAIRARGNG